MGVVILCTISTEFAWIDSFCAITDFKLGCVLDFILHLDITYVNAEQWQRLLLI